MKFVEITDSNPLHPRTWEIRNQHGEKIGTTTNKELVARNHEYSDYIQDAIRTESLLSEVILHRSGGRILHASLGISDEAGEIAKAVKAHIYYGKTLDTANLVEEAGDVMWYLAVLLDELGYSFEAVMRKNIAKRKARYPEKFTQEHALNRNLTKEKTAMENA